MAVDKKISQLTSLAQVDVSASTDVLPIVDTSATETKKITVSALVGAGATAGISGAVLTNGTINSTTIGATTPSTGAFTTLSASGNLTFSSTGQRITGDMSNATIGNRLAVQNSVTNGNTVLGLLPNGTATTSAVQINNNSDTTAALGFGNLQVSTTEFQIAAAIRNAGTYLPMTFYTGGSERMRLDTSGNLLVGTATGLAGSRFTVVGGGTQLSGGTTAQEGVRIQRATGYATFTGINNDNNAYNGLQFFTGASAAATIDTSGNVGIGGTAGADTKVNALGTYPTSGTVTRVFFANGTIPSGTTAEANGFQTSLNTQAAAFTLGSLFHFQANGGTFGASSAVTNQYGFAVASSLTGATNNYGFYSNIASGSNRWNFYANGTADNYFAGNVYIATTSAQNNSRLRVVGGSTSGLNYTLLVEGSGGADNFYVRDDGEMYSLPTYNRTSASASNVGVDAAGGFFRSTSSLRYKTNVVDAAHGLADVLKLRSVTYKGKNDGDKIFGGLIAEEVHDAGLTEFVAYDKEGRPDALHYGNMVALLVKAVQELKAELEALKAA